MKTLSAISRRLSLMIGRCVIRAAEASGGRVLVALEGLEDEGGSGCELAEPTSFTSVPPSGAEGVALSIMGERGHRVILSLGDRRFRPRDLTQGEASLFDCAGGGNRIDVLKDRIRITAPARLEILTPHATINGQAIATVGDEVDVQGGSSAGRHLIVTGVGDPG